jgi:hypothetical protein
MRGKCINSECRKFNQTVETDSILCSACGKPLVEFMDEPKIKLIGIIICIIIGGVGGVLIGKFLL